MRKLVFIISFILGVFGWPKASDAAEIVGLVAPGGTGASKVGGSSDWNFTVRMNHWRMPDGSLHEGTLTAFTKVEYEEIQSWYEKIPVLKVIKFTGKMSGEFDDDIYRFEVISFGGEAIDTELEMVATNLKKPVIFKDDLLGNFQLNRSLNWFEGEGNWNEDNISIYVNTTLSDDSKIDLEALANLRSLFKKQEDWEKRLKSYAAENLLELKNDNWLRKNEDEFSAHEFMEKLNIETVQTYSNGDFEVFFNDGGLFWGHSIIVSGSLEGGPTDASIAG